MMNALKAKGESVANESSQKNIKALVPNQAIPPFIMNQEKK